jgi:hypothetical protein
VFEDFVDGRGQALQRFGYALTGDWGLAEDLLQTALARAYPRWSRVRNDDPEAYVRKIMINTWSSWWRRRWRGEVPTSRLPEVSSPDGFAAADSRQALRAALAKLPPGQRAAPGVRSISWQAFSAHGLRSGTTPAPSGIAVTNVGWLTGQVLLTGWPPGLLPLQIVPLSPG